MAAFVDTSALLAILDSDDRHHAEASAAWSRLVEGNRPIHTTNYVVIETISLLHHRFGVEAVRLLVNDLLAVVTVHWVEEAAHAAGVSAVIAGGRTGPSLVDCVSFVVIGRLRLPSVLAFDRHFTERGFSF